MIIFEGKAFDEKKVITIEIDNYHRVVLSLSEKECLVWPYKNDDTAISKISEITTLINEREEQLLKLTHSIRIY